MKTDRTIADEFLRNKAREEADRLKVEEKLRAEAEKAEALKPVDSELEVHTTKPMISLPVVKKSPWIICPFCD